MILWSIWHGTDVLDHTGFLVAETLITVIILLDFIFRVRLVGVRKYFKKPGNIFDFIVILGCLVLWPLFLISSSAAWVIAEEIGEEICVTVWSIWQSLRLIVFLKNQKKASEARKDIIQFVSIDSEEHAETENDVVIEMK